MPELTSKKKEVVAKPKSEEKEKKPKGTDPDTHGPGVGDKKSAEREVKFPEDRAYICKGAKAITVKKAKEMLDWEDEDEYVSRRCLENPNRDPDKERAAFKKAAEFKDINGKWVVCWNNLGNRELTESWAKSLGYTHLNRKFHYNGESIIIGQYGSTLSAQHRLIGLVMAWQIREKDLETWKKLWPEEPVMESVVVVGVPETEEVIATLDNVRPRSLADVIYTSPLFARKAPSDKRTLSKMLEVAVYLLWKRTGAKTGFNPYPNHGAAMDFVGRHKSKLLACVDYIHTKCVEKAHGPAVIGITPGTAAGLMFLMASSNTDSEAYHSSDNPTEKKMDWGNWAKAADFWLFISAGNPAVTAIRDARARLIEDPSPEKGSKNEMMTVLSKAWQAWAENGVVTDADVMIADEEYITKNDGVTRVLAGVPGMGGIDQGIKLRRSEEEEEEGGEEASPTPDQVASEAEETSPRRSRTKVKSVAGSAAEDNGEA